MGTEATGTLMLVFATWPSANIGLAVVFIAYIGLLVVVDLLGRLLLLCGLVVATKSSSSCFCCLILSPFHDGLVNHLPLKCGCSFTNMTKKLVIISPCVCLWTFVSLILKLPHISEQVRTIILVFRDVNGRINGK